MFTSQEIEKGQLRNQGDISLYTDQAIATRIGLREDKKINRILDAWWASAFRFFDTDKVGHNKLRFYNGCILNSSHARRFMAKV